MSKMDVSVFAIQLFIDGEKASQLVPKSVTVPTSSVTSSTCQEGQKWKNLPDFYLFFPIFPPFSNFFPLFPDFFLFFPILGNFFAVSGGSLVDTLLIPTEIWSKCWIGEHYNVCSEMWWPEVTSNSTLLCFIAANMLWNKKDMLDRWQIHLQVVKLTDLY